MVVAQKPRAEIVIGERKGYILRKKLGNRFDKLKEETSSRRVSTFAVERGWPSRRESNLTAEGQSQNLKAIRRLTKCEESS